MILFFLLLVEGGRLGAWVCRSAVPGVVVEVSYFAIIDIDAYASGKCAYFEVCVGVVFGPWRCPIDKIFCNGTKNVQVTLDFVNSMAK